MCVKMRTKIVGFLNVSFSNNTSIVSLNLFLLPIFVDGKIRIKYILNLSEIFIFLALQKLKIYNISLLTFINHD